MEISDIVAYVRHTPENTNPAVIASMCGELSGGGGGSGIHVVTFTEEDDDVYYSPDVETIGSWYEEQDPIIVGVLERSGMTFNCQDEDDGYVFYHAYSESGTGIFLNTIVVAREPTTSGKCESATWNQLYTPDSGGGEE